MSTPSVPADPMLRSWLWGVVVPLYLMDFPPFGVICLVRQRIHALPYLAAYCSVSALPEKYRHFWILCALYPAVFGENVLVRQWIHAHARGCSCSASGRQNFVKFQCSGLWLHEKVFVFSADAWSDGYTLMRQSTAPPEFLHIFSTRRWTRDVYLGHHFTCASFPALTCRYLFRLRQGQSCRRSASLFSQLATSTSSLWTT